MTGINWDALNQAARNNAAEQADQRAAKIARAEASKIVVGALTGLHEKITGMFHVEQNTTRAGLLYGIAGAVQDTIREIKTYGYDTEPPAALSRPASTPPDVGPHCGDSTCLRTHGVSGRHT